MTMAKVGRWRANLAVRVPLDIAAAMGLTAGEGVEIEARDGEIVIRRSEAIHRRRAKALAAVAEILAERHKHSLAGLNIRDLIEDGRP